MYIAIEGIKGAGKSTLFSGVMKSLEARGLCPVALRPTAPRAHSLIDSIFQSTGCYWPDALIERLYATRSNQAARLAPKRDCLVVGERSVLTSYVSRWDMNDPRAGMARVDGFESAIRLPDQVIYLSIPVELALERIRTRARRGYGCRDQSPARLYEADRLYRHLAASRFQYGLGSITWHFVDATAPPESIVTECARLVAKAVLNVPSGTPTMSLPEYRCNWRSHIHFQSKGEQV